MRLTLFFGDEAGSWHSIYLRQGGVLQFVPKDSNSICSLRKSDKGADTDLMYDFCLPYIWLVGKPGS